MIMLRNHDVCFPSSKLDSNLNPLAHLPGPGSVTEVFCKCNFVYQWKMAISLE